MDRRLLPSISALAAFEAVARIGSFTAAADELGLTQGAISRQILALEDTLEARLFERGRDGARLTNAGTAYAAEIGPALRRISSATLNMITTKGHGGSIVLGILPTFGTRWLIPRLPGFFEEHPDVAINFMTRIESRDLVQDGLDAAILIGGGDWPNCVAEHLLDEDLLPVCSAQFLEAANIEAPGDVAGLQLLHLRTRPNAWRQWFADNGVESVDTAGMTFEQFSMASQAAMAGIGVAMLPAFLIGEELASGRLVPVFPRLVRSDVAYFFVYPQANADSPAIRALSLWLSEQATEFRSKQVELTPCG